MALTVGLFVDVVLRATGTSWDIVWRTDALAWGLTVALLVGLAAAAAVAVRAGAVPDADDRGAGLSIFLLWPYLYLAIVYTENPGFLDSAGGVRYAAGLALALLTAVLAVVALVGAARWGLPRAVVVPAALVLAVLGFVLGGDPGAVVIVAAVVAQIVAAALLGAASGAASRHRTAGHRACPPRRSPEARCGSGWRSSRR